MRSTTTQQTQRRLELLRSRVAAEDSQAQYELGHDLLEGIRDSQGRVVLRRNSPYAVRLLRSAAEAGIIEAYSPLAYAFDLGLGTRPNRAAAERWYRRAYRNGNSMSAINLASIHRDAGDLRSAFRWWRRAAELHDGDAMVDVAYCYQYGIGVRKNLPEARKLYRRAIRSTDIIDYGREEGMYGLAVSYADVGQVAKAIPLLKAAAADGDYPEAATLLTQIINKEPLDPCRCRRFIRKTLRGHARCSMHQTGRKRG